MDRHPQILFEQAKDGNATCQMVLDGDWRYVYSKYEPAKIQIRNIPSDSPLLLLGIGLGYELQWLLENTDQEILVVEKHRQFISFIEQGPLSPLLKSPRVSYAFEEDYLLLPQEKREVVVGHTALFNYSYYQKARSALVLSEKAKVLLFEHPTIAKDCQSALQTLGYEVVTTPHLSLEKLLQKTLEEGPDYLFTINVRSHPLKLGKKSGIQYIAWNVDTPVYSVYSEEAKSSQVALFGYDRAETLALQEKGFANAHYLPVAAPLQRLTNQTFSKEDRARYSASISFVGSTCHDNEYNEYRFAERLSKETLEQIAALFEEQRRSIKPILFDRLTSPLVAAIERELGTSFSSPYLDSRQKLTYLLGRKYTELERKEMIQKVATHFPTKVYGDDSWLSVQAPHLQYMGHAEHYHVMPKVFHLSDININLTRAYVPSGLPMRVFDILACQGFLLSNDREDLHRLFQPGKDLALFGHTEDLLAKIDHYLTFANERLEMIQHSQETIRLHTFENRLQEMMQKIKAPSLPGKRPSSVS
ncbi:MAG: hypothetical protein K0S07_875 [Chlamydiales bacterium]|jgi:spore maturation protein CgeB|nr:hypothetical protein [Chlamydiales bacterium]